MSDFSDALLALEPALYWALDAETGASDLSGNGRDGTGAGGVAIGGHSATYPPILGAEPSCTDFADMGITSGYSPFAAASSRSFLGWALRDDRGYYHVLFSDSAADNCHLRCEAGTDDTTGWFGSMIAHTDAWPDPGEWVFWVFAVDDDLNVAKLYLNATEVAASSGTWSSWGGSGSLRIGSRHDQGLGWNGKMGPFAALETMITAEDVATLYDYALNGAPPPPAFGYTPRVRENPPLRLHILAHTPNGNSFRWGQDERRAENNYSDLSFSTTIPGGFETMDCSLPRKTRVNYQDLTRLSTLTVKGAGGQVAGEYRLEKTPRSSGLGERSIKPQAVGWQAHLDDDKEAAEVYVDRDLNNWGGMARQRQANLYTAGTDELADGSVSPDGTTGIPGLVLTITATGGALGFVTESWYDAGSACRIKDIYYDYTSQNTTAGYTGFVGTSSDDIATVTSTSADLIAAGNDSGTNAGYAQTFTAYRFASAAFSVDSPPEGDHTFNLRRLTLWGTHGLQKRGSPPTDGLYSSDVIANALSRWCPLLHFTTGSDGTIRPTAFVVPQLSFREFTTAAEILTQSNRFHLWDWAVWEGPRDGEPTFYYNERNGRGKRWRARVAPSNLQETGPQVDRLFNGIIVSYQDVDGTSKTVGPTGSLADATSSDLIDTDPLNPVNQLGMRHYGTLDMGIVSTSAGATEVGRQFLERSKELDQSGSADLVGYVTDDHGVNRPSWAVRAGDQISFVDSSDPSYRRVVHTAYDHSSRTNSIDLDSPPEGMDALLEELGAVLVLGTPPPTPVGSG